MRRLRGMETLEPRTLLSANVGFHQLALDPTSGVYASSAAAGYTSPPAGAFTPAQIRSVYGINSITGDPTKSDGTGQTIAIIDGFDHPGMVGTADPNFINSDLAKFDAQFGLPDPPSFTKLDQNGGTNYPAVDPDGFWEQETSLDVEWAHAIAPKANLVLIEAASGNVDAVSFTALMTAVNTARNLPNVSVISMSFGFPESSIRSWFGQGAEVNYDQLFTTPTGHGGITYVAASGDTGYPGCYPAYSPNVLAIGGTKLTITNGNASEVGWSYAYDSTSGKYLGSGGGQSGIESEPSFQLGVQNTNFRQIPDVAIVGANSPGVAIYCSFNSPTAPWLAIGGTSLSTPCWAGLVAIADQLRAANGLGSLDGRSKTLPLLYSLPASDFNDILSGTNGHDVAGAGYDLVTGRGSPVADKLVPDLASFIPPPPTLTSTLTDTVPAQTTQVAIAFSGPVIGAGNVSNYQLQSVGPDGLLGTTDDVIWPLSVNVSGTTVYLTLPQLTEGVYRLTVHDGVTNLLGAKRQRRRRGRRRLVPGFRRGPRRRHLVLRRDDLEFRRFHAFHGRRRRFQSRRPARSGRDQWRRQHGDGVLGQRRRRIRGPGQVPQRRHAAEQSRRGGLQPRRLPRPGRGQLLQQRGQYLPRRRQRRVFRRRRDRRRYAALQSGRRRFQQRHEARPGRGELRQQFGLGLLDSAIRW